jgi:tetratricopeptide (TPR) repeat protein
MRLKLLLVILLAISEPGFGQQGNTQGIASYLVAAQEAQARKDYAAAESAYEAAVKARSDMPELWANLGLMQNALGHYPDAIESFRRAILLKPDLYVPNLFLGIDYIQTNRAQQAIPFLVKAESINAHDPQAPLSLGKAYLAMREFTAAKSAFSRAITLDRGASSAWFGLGIAALDKVGADGWKLSAKNTDSVWAKALFAESLQEELRFKEAVSEEQAVLSIDPYFPCAHSQIGFLYHAQREDAAALREFAAEPGGCPLTGLGRARLHIDMGEDTEALAILRTLWERDPGFVRSHISLLVGGLTSERSTAFSAFLERESGRDGVGSDLSASLSAGILGTHQDIDGFSLEAGGKGSEILTSAQEAEADDHAGRFSRCAAHLAGGIPKEGDHDLLLLASCAFMTGDFSLSAAASDLLARKSPQDLGALYWSVKANEQLASLAFDQFEQLQPESERTHLLLGDMYRQRQRYERAESEYEAASVLAPRDPAPLYGLAWAYFHGSNPDKALHNAKKALGISPNDPDINLLVGEILVSLHQRAQAEDYLKAGLDVKPQMLPHLHALMGEVYEHTGRVQDAISELQMGLTSDEDGSLHYQLARMYIRLGDKAAAENALQVTKELEHRRRERAAIAVQDSSDVMQNDLP